MSPPHRTAVALVVCLLGSVSAAPAAQASAAQPLDFQVTFAPAVCRTAFTGRVYVLLSRQAITEPPRGPNWFKPEPFFARDVKDWRPGEPRALGADVLRFPTSLPQLPRGTYYVQAVMDFDRGERSFSAADGNGYSKAIRLDLDAATSGPIKLVIDQVFRAPRFQETERVKLVDIESRLLSTFHGRPVRLRAGVVLPRSYATRPGRRYPVIYEIPGFGGTHFLAHKAAERNATDVAGIEMLYVMLDPSCRLGHHAFADSENNGPWSRALREELIPHVEKTYRGLGVPAARFLTGHSSGGWSSLWLQVTSPDFFGGTWSTAPDPVDFRDFQRVNIYKIGTNLFRDDAGRERPLARKGGKVVVYYQPFSDMEVVMGHGGQLASFEAVFSPRGADGKPRPLWNRATGRIDADVARSWERYDIRLVLARNWKMLGPRLAGKIHLYMGAEDTFYLEGAARLLKQTLEHLGSDAVVEIFPNRDHGTLLDRALRVRIAKEMAETFRRQNPQYDQ